MPPTTSTFVVAAIVRRDEQLLLVEEREVGDTESTWMLPGGKVEAGETLIQALERELAEETGLRLVHSPIIAFAIDISRAEGRYSAITFDCQADGTLAPNDPDGLILAAAYMRTDAVFARLRCVTWYDCVPLERYVSGEASAGSTYVAEQT